MHLCQKWEGGFTDNNDDKDDEDDNHKDDKDDNGTDTVEGHGGVLRWAAISGGKLLEP